MDNSEEVLKVLVIGNDNAMTYLLNRYADQSGLLMSYASTMSALAEVQNGNPTFIIFSSLDALRESERWLGELSDKEMQILVCSGVGDEAAAREMGADNCLFHPVTYQSFCNALAINNSEQVN